MAAEGGGRGLAWPQGGGSFPRGRRPSPCCGARAAGTPQRGNNVSRGKSPAPARRGAGGTGGQGAALGAAGRAAPRHGPRGARGCWRPGPLLLEPGSAGPLLTPCRRPSPPPGAGRALPGPFTLPGERPRGGGSGRESRTWPGGLPRPRRGMRRPAPAEAPATRPAAVALLSQGSAFAFPFPRLKPSSAALAGVPGCLSLLGGLSPRSDRQM